MADKSPLPKWTPRHISLRSADVATGTVTSNHRVIRIAHRGASAYAQENSLAAFKKAAEQHADMVEVDIHATRDGVPVVAHDDNLIRIFNVQGRVDELTLEELRGKTPSDREPIPTFEEVAEMCASLGLGLYLDIKHWDMGLGRAIFETLDRHTLLDQAIFGSTHPDWLADIKAFVPRALTSILFHSVNLDPVSLARSIRCDYVHPCWENAVPEPHRLLTSDWLERIRATGLGIVCWHEERLAEIAALYRLGVDAICSDKPDLLFEIACQR